ncbi:MAG: hypothetical protein Q9205_007159 [Flavoplaca limonia]
MVSGQTTIFSLPREIRDEIYDLVLNSPRTPPSCPQQAGVRYEEVIGMKRYGCELASILYPSPNSDHGSGSVLSQVNRQLRQESRDFITNPYLTSSVTSKLDAMLQGPRLWLSWTSVPHSMPKMDNLEIDLRIFDTPDDGGIFCSSIRAQNVVIMLLRAIDLLLDYGPSFRCQDDALGLKVDTLTIILLHRYDKLFRPDEQWMKDHESSEPDDTETSEEGHVHNLLSSHLGDFVRRGFFSDKVQTLRFSSIGALNVYRPRNIEPSRKRFFHMWCQLGVDKYMRVEKVNSADLRTGKDEKQE